MKRKWHKEIKAWADGETIQGRTRFESGDWTEWEDLSRPCFMETDVIEYRIKPYKKPDEVRYGRFNFRLGGLPNAPYFCSPNPDKKYIEGLYSVKRDDSNLKIVFEDDLEGGYTIKSFEWIG